VITGEGIAMSRNRRNYTTALFGFDAVVRRVPGDRWAEATCCEGWCARDVVVHSVGVGTALASMAETGELALPATPEPEHDVVAQWTASRDRVLEALDRPGVLDQVGRYWIGESTIDDLLGFAQWDPLIHTWDLATAVGLPPLVDQRVAEAALAVIEPMAEGLRKRHLIGEPVEMPADADPMTRLLGVTGRCPPVSDTSEPERPN
jgi:uncharacterized protein (TIGR03086 family)